VPVAPARAMAPNLPVVAVVLSNLEPSPLNITALPDILVSFPLLRQITRFRVAQAFNVFLHSIDIGSRYLTALRLKIDKPEVVIQPELKGIGILDKVDINEIADRGEKATVAMLPELRKQTGWLNKFGRYLRTRSAASFETY
jgi:hypothetical protein